MKLPLLNILSLLSLSPTTVSHFGTSLDFTIVPSNVKCIWSNQSFLRSTLEDLCMRPHWEFNHARRSLTGCPAHFARLRKTERGTEGCRLHTGGAMPPEHEASIRTAHALLNQPMAPFCDPVPFSYSQVYFPVYTRFQWRQS
ncbi:hypothetical protein SISSUDRAFT_342843 [Sistotremastrum suecicum HHB10207 ss-3]|uniref:Uncharacterized protein n=1 Tax=Sistotremastrum suecicum HHB10207 ss-3 TaxID=1314776 RepID=A0A166IZ67_9AGAM|nr:hypothetical protein SISSUDRAFT_342843 [Sistotremastrum suecicum HHB10207 ss-3]